METSVNQKEAQKFASMATEWWDENGKFKPLHKFNPVRLEYICNTLAKHFAGDIKQPKFLKNLDVLDIGCGGGLLCEPLARLGANVTGIDVVEKNIEVAKLHAKQSNLKINYQTISVEEIAKQNKKFDVILNMEVVEHVDNIEFFLSQCCALMKKNSQMFIATINRTWKAKALAIFMAENILRWLPRGTHEYEKLVRPVEIKTILEKQNKKIVYQTGIVYSPFSDSWQFSKDMDVNYILVAS